jgi:hypothetical protein
LEGRATVDVSFSPLVEATAEGAEVTSSRTGAGRVAGIRVGMEVRSTFGAAPRQDGVNPQLETVIKLT